MSMNDNVLLNSAIVLGQNSRADSIVRLLELILPDGVHGERSEKWPCIFPLLQQKIPALRKDLTSIQASTPNQAFDISLLFIPFEYLNEALISNLISFKQLKQTAIYDVPNDEQALQLLQRGIGGVFYQNEPLENFAKGGRIILNGELWFKRSLLSQHILSSDEGQTQVQDVDCSWPEIFSTISRRELEVLALLAQGAKNDYIGKQLFISTHTVKTHVSHIFRKLALRTRAEVASWAVQNKHFLKHHVPKHYN